MKLAGYSEKDPILYDTETDIVRVLEQRFGRDSGDYFVLTEQSLKNAKTKETFHVVYVEDKSKVKHQLFFKKQ